MSQKRKTKEEIVAEYLTGNYTYRELGLKYDIPFRSICDWVSVNGLERLLKTILPYIKK